MLVRVNRVFSELSIGRYLGRSALDEFDYNLLKDGLAISIRLATVIAQPTRQTQEAIGLIQPSHIVLSVPTTDFDNEPQAQPTCQYHIQVSGL